MPNHSGNNFRHARKCQTTRKTTFAQRGNAKLLGKRLSPSAEMPDHSGNNFRHARKCPTTRETTFAQRGNVDMLGALATLPSYEVCANIERESCHTSITPSRELGVDIIIAIRLVATRMVYLSVEVIAIGYFLLIGVNHFQLLLSSKYYCHIKVEARIPCFRTAL